MTIYYSPSFAGFFDDEIHGAIPSDAVSISPETHANMLEKMYTGGSVSVTSESTIQLHDPIALDVTQLTKLCSDAIQSKIEEVARSWGYDSIISASTYLSSSVDKFKSEAGLLIAWRDAVWLWAATLKPEQNILPSQAATAIALVLTGLPAAPARP